MAGLRCTMGFADCHLLTRGLVALSLVLASCGTDVDARDVPTSDRYEELVELFHDWRDFQRPAFHDGVPDYTPDAMAAQARELPGYQARLAAIDPSGWPVSDQVDHHIVRAEMNGMEFDHRVVQPWARMPSFYKVVNASQPDTPAREGQVMHGVIDLWSFDLPLDEERLAELRGKVQAVPAMLDQARDNLTGDSRDYWMMGIQMKEGEARSLDAFAERAAQYHPELAEDVRTAREAVDSFREWLQAGHPSRTGESGVGVENYNWFLKNVLLMPYTWEDELTLVQRELHRAWTYLALAENRSRNHPPLEPVSSQEEYERAFRQAVRDFMDFLREEEIMTMHGYEEEAQLAREGRFNPSEDQWSFFTQVNHRDFRPLRAHMIHWVDLARMEEDPHPSPIRSVPLLYNIWVSRAEGFSTGLEEMAMEAGLYGDDPRVRELVWVLAAQRAARAIGSLRMHSGEMTLEDAARSTVAWTPHGWLSLDRDLVWGEVRFYMEMPGYGTSYMTAKMHMERLLADRRQQLGSDFVLKEFMDEFYASGMIPLSLIRWEMTGHTDEIEWLLGEESAGAGTGG